MQDSDWRPITQAPSAASAASAATAGRHPPAIAPLFPNLYGAGVPPPVPSRLIQQLQMQVQQQQQQQQQRQPLAGGQQGTLRNMAFRDRGLQLPVGIDTPCQGKPSAHVLAAQRLLQVVSWAC